MHIRYSPLAQQFAHVDEIFDELRALVASGDFTLGKPVREFEEMFAAAVGVGEGDGLGRALRARREEIDGDVVRIAVRAHRPGGERAGEREAQEMTTAPVRCVRACVSLICR